MKKILKQGITPTQAQEVDDRVRRTVELVLSDIQQRGDLAVRRALCPLRQLVAA